MATSPQAAVVELQQKIEPLRRVVERSPALLVTTDAFASAIGSFGSAELYARAGERREALGLAPVEHPGRSSVKHHNERGLVALGHARKEAAKFRDEGAEHGDKTLDPERIDALEEDLLEALADLELKPSDVAKINARMRKLLGSVREHGAAGLEAELSGALKDLEKARRRADRGVVDNIPLWKALAIVVFLGVGLFSLFRCAWWGECHPLENVAWIAFDAVLWFITVFC